MSQLSEITSEKQYLKTAMLRGSLILISIVIVSISITAIFYRNAPDDEWWRAILTGLAIPAIVSPPIILSTIKRNTDIIKLMNQIRVMAFYDDLTGLKNRRAFMQKAETLLAHHNFSEENIALMIIDIDHFKRVNDKFGHAAGDAALSHISRVMETALPDDALLARLGGEEFAISIKFDAMADLHEFAEAIRQSVAAQPLIFEKQAIAMTISVGVSIAYEDDTVSTLLSRADVALYDAKHAGRDQIAIAA